MLIRQLTQAINALRCQSDEFRQTVPQAAANAAQLIVTCPAAHADERFNFEVSARGSSLQGGTVFEATPVTASLTAATGSDNSAQMQDVEIAAIVAKTWSAHIVATAAKINRDGAFREAEEYAEKELRYFRPYVQNLSNGPALIGELDLLSRRVGRRFSERMRKEMVVQASLAMESCMDRRGMGKASWSARMERGE